MTEHTHTHTHTAAGLPPSGVNKFRSLWAYLTVQKPCHICPQIKMSHFTSLKYCQFFPHGTEPGIKYQYFSKYWIKVRYSSIVTALLRSLFCHLRYVVSDLKKKSNMKFKIFPICITINKHILAVNVSIVSWFSWLCNTCKIQPIPFSDM